MAKQVTFNERLTFNFSEIKENITRESNYGHLLNQEDLIKIKNYNMGLSIIIYNEAENIENILPTLLNFLNEGNKISLIKIINDDQEIIKNNVILVDAQNDYSLEDSPRTVLQFLIFENE